MTESAEEMNIKEGKVKKDYDSAGKVSEDCRRGD